MRVGCADRLLHTMTCGRWKTNNTTKLLRDAGYCMGYPRILAVCLEDFDFFPVEVILRHKTRDSC